MSRTRMGSGTVTMLPASVVPPRGVDICEHGPSALRGLTDQTIERACARGRARVSGVSTPRMSTEVRRQQIAEAALRIISSKGVHRLTAQELGREVGIADGTIFRHFKDKAEIVRAAIAHLEGVLFKSFPPEAEDPLERLQTFFVGRLTLIQRMPSVFLAAFSERLEEAAGEDAGVVRSIIDRSQAFVRQCLAEGQERRLIDPTLSLDALTLVVVGTLQAAAFARRRSSGKSVSDPIKIWQTVEIMLTSAIKK